MANAKRCDICGGFYEVPTISPFSEEWNNTSMVRVIKRDYESDRVKHDVMQFDTCEKCRQDVLDYILTRKAEATSKEETK